MPVVRHNRFTRTEAFFQDFFMALSAILVSLPMLAEGAVTSSICLIEMGYVFGV